MSKLLTVSQVARMLNVSEDTVTRRFSREKGVVDLGTAETPKRRRYRVLRIPQSVVEKFVLKRGGSATMESPEERPSRSKKQAMSEEEIAQQLARLGSQRGAEAQKTLDKIAERARLLKFVPESQWSDVVWFDEEDES